MKGSKILFSVPIITLETTGPILTKLEAVIKILENNVSDVLHPIKQKGVSGIGNKS